MLVIFWILMCLRTGRRTVHIIGALLECIHT